MDRTFEAFAGIDPIGLARAAAGGGEAPHAEAYYRELLASGVAFASSEPLVQSMYYRALGLLSSCVLTSPLGTPMLIEGGVYRGCWLESTATIGAETLSRFCPDIARSTFELFARLRRPDGLIPYKVLAGGPAAGGPAAGGPAAGGAAFRQVQMVTPLARSVWTHAGLNGEGEPFLLEMYEAMSDNDAWLAKHRDTRRSGGVEAFCAFDTGHDLSPRFWHCPDTTFREDPAAFDPESPLLPFIAPDMTANVYCQRLYLARMARKLGRESEASSWESKSRASLECLMEKCWDPEDEFFYDLDKAERFVRVQSDVLLRILACEVGDDDLFERALSRYLLNMRKFFARYPFTSIAMDDPRFDPASSYNTWGGPTNVLSIIRASAAFEAHGRHAELVLALQPALQACARMSRFGQILSPWTGEEGYTECYSPALLLALDLVERLTGILPRPEGELWFSSLRLPPLGGHDNDGASTAYSRIVDGRLFEFESGSGGARALRDGGELFACPRGIRVVTDRSGGLLRLIGLAVHPIAGTLRYQGVELPFSIEGNEVLEFGGDVSGAAAGGAGSAFRSVKKPGVIAPSYS